MQVSWKAGRDRTGKNVTANAYNFECINRLQYLGAVIISDNDISSEIKARILNYNIPFCALQDICFGLESVQYIFKNTNAQNWISKEETFDELALNVGLYFYTFISLWFHGKQSPKKTFGISHFQPVKWFKTTRHGHYEEDDIPIRGTVKMWYILKMGQFNDQREKE